MTPSGDHPEDHEVQNDAVGHNKDACPPVDHDAVSALVLEGFRRCKTKLGQEPEFLYQNMPAPMPTRLCLEVSHCTRLCQAVGGLEGRYDDIQG